MVKIGSLVELVAVTLADWNNHQLAMQTEAHQNYTKSLEGTLSTFKKIGTSHHLDLIIQAEELMVLRERELYGQEDRAVLPSLNAAVADFAVIKSSVETVKIFKAYQQAATTYHDKKKTQGVIADGCHEALNSHITRLGNRTSAVGVSVAEKNVLRQRQSNMRVAKELYMELQRKALGVEPPIRSKGRKSER